MVSASAIHFPNASFTHGKPVVNILFCKTFRRHSTNIVGFQGISFSLQRSCTDGYFAYQEVDTVIESLKGVQRNIEAVHGQWFRDAKTIAEQVSPLKLVIFFYCIVYIW